VKRLLLVSQLAPPSALIAARRVAALTKYLAREDFEITVLTSELSGEGEIEGAAEVVRTRDLLASGLNWRRSSLEVMSSGAPGTYRKPSPLQSVLVPDPAAVTWLPFALRAAARLGAFDCVLTTSPPQSTHLVGAALARRQCWIAELRDGWTFEPPRPDWPLAPLRTLDRRLERSLRRAAAVVGVTQPIADDVRDRLGLDAHVITNGFDPEDAVAPVWDVDGLLDRERQSLVHTGRVGVTGRSLTPLLDALRERVGEERLEIVFAGPLEEGELMRLQKHVSGHTVKVVGNLERPRALRLQRAADALLLLTRGARSEATGKLFEYLTAGRPILCVGEGTAAAAIVHETRTGEVVAANDVPALSAALAKAAAGGLEWSPDEAAIGRYSWPSLAGAYAGLLRSVAH